MKRKFKWVILTLSICLITHAYLIYRYQRIDIYVSKDFKKESTIPAMSITDRNTLSETSLFFITSKGINGELNVAEPNYILEIYGFNNSLKTAYLWIDKENINGMYMYERNTSKGYTISKKNTQKLNNIINSSKS